MKNEIMLPEFTREDFTESSRPYEWLYEHRNDKFLLKQLTNRMAAQAGSVGVRGFMALFNAYCQSMAEREGVVQGRVTEFEGQPLELLSGEYICAEPTVSVMDKFGYTEVVCRHPIMPVKRLVNIDSGEERLELAYKKGRVWRRIVVEKSVIASSNKILDLASVGIFVNSDNAKALSTYILAMEEINYDRIPEQNSVGRLGWVGSDSFSPYVGDLIFDGETSCKHIFASVQSAGSYDKWLEAARKVRAEKSEARIALAASFASVILEPCGLLPFFTHFWGGTENGKTVLLMLAASVWASPKLGSYVTTFNATNVGMEMTASFLNSLPMCVDELQIQSSSGIRDFDRIIYQLTEGVGRTRGAKMGGLQRQNTWRNCIITNGEHPISNANSGGGAVNRIIEIECPSKVYSDLVGLCAVLNENYGHAGRRFVEMLQVEGARDYANGLQKHYFRELLKCDSTEKQAASAAAILAADALATSCIFNDENELTVEDLVRVMAKKSDVDVNMRALDYVYELVSRNPAHFVSAFDGDCKVEVWGRTDVEYIYFVKSVFDREMALAGFNSTSFLSWAKRRGLIQCDKDGRRTKKAKVGNSVVNTVCICKSHDDIFYSGKS